MSSLFFMLSSLCGLLCLCVWVYHCLKCTRASHVSNGAETLPPATFQGVRPAQVPDGLLEFFLWGQLEWKATPTTHSLSFSILLKLIWDQPTTLHSIFHKQGKEQRRESFPLSKCRTIHQTGLLTADTSQRHSLGMFLIICLLADVPQYLLGKSR